MPVFGSFVGLLRWVAGMVFLALLLADPAAAIVDAREAMALWAGAVAPSLFPFMAALPLLASREAGRVYARLLGGATRALFGLPGAAAAALTAALVAGSPAGALACAQSAAGLRRGEFKRLALTVCGVGPVYLVSGVGAALFASRRLGLLLAGAQLLAQLLTGLLLRPLFRGETEALPPAPPPVPGAPMRTAVLNVLQVAGYMAFFAVLSGMLGRLFGGAVGTAARLLLDLPGGAALAARLPLPLETRFLLTAALAGFGGLCIGAQNMAVLGPLGLRWREYLPVKLGQGALCLILCRAGLRLGAMAGPEAPPLPGETPLRLAALAMLVPLVLGLLGFLRRRSARAKET